MARNQSLKNPVQYLKNRVTQNGHSGENGTYLIGASVVIEPTAHAHSDTFQDARDFFQGLIEKDDLFAKMIALLATDPDITRTYYHLYEYFGVQGASLHVLRDASKMSLLSFLPEVEVEEFEADVELLSHLTIMISKVAGCETGTLRLTIGRAELSWERMEEENLLYSVDRESN